jgi:hypothetical protein
MGNGNKRLQTLLDDLIIDDKSKNVLKTVRNEFNNINTIYETNSFIFSDYNDEISSEFEDSCDLGKSYKLINLKKTTFQLITTY